MITLDRCPQIRSMMGGTLDDKSLLKSGFSLWCSSAQPWLTLPPSIEQFPDYPDGLIAQKNVRNFALTGAVRYPRNEISDAVNIHWGGCYEI